MSIPLDKNRYMVYNYHENKSVSFETLFNPQKKEVMRTEKTNRQDRKEIFELFASSPLFRGASKESIDYAIDCSSVSECKKGERIESESSCLFIILSGTASVVGISKTQTVILNTLKKGRVFGMASLFGEKCGTTAIVAGESCVYAVITQEVIEELLKRDIGFTKNYICFLSDKIRFLNKKIAFFTSGKTEKKLAGYLLSLPLENNEIRLEMNMSSLAKNLDMGRASLYRAFDALEENGFIKRTNNIVKITSPEEFRKIYGETL